MQWAFVAFLMGHSLEGLLQWRAVLLLLLGSFAYPQKLPQGPQLYCPALKVPPALESAASGWAGLSGTHQGRAKLHTVREQAMKQQHVLPIMSSSTDIGH